MAVFRVLWITPEKHGGIRSYADALWPYVKKIWPGDGVDPLFELPETSTLERLQPDLIHVQHEFGLFGSKIPGRYCFPGWIKEVRRALPRVKIVATAHTVLGRDYVYPWRGRGWQTPVRWVGNHTAVPLMRPFWRERTWGGLDGVIVHSKLQVESVQESGCRKVVEIPHFVPETLSLGSESPSSPEPTVMVFGYLTPEKGQDLLIRAWPLLKSTARLILAGGLRREADKPYLESCERLVQELGLGGRIRITGFVADHEVDRLYQQAELVVAPFRETAGSGSLVQAISRGAAILASDLPLNREIAQRQPGSLAFFKSEDAADCAFQVDRLLGDLGAREKLKGNALSYAEMNSLPRIAQKHLDFYRSLGK